MKKEIVGFVTTILSLIVGLVFYLTYIHAVSWLSYPIGLVVLVFVVLVLIGAAITLFVNLKDFIVSIFKENKEVDEKGFKKHF